MKALFDKTYCQFPINKCKIIDASVYKVLLLLFLVFSLFSVIYR